MSFFIFTASQIWGCIKRYHYILEKKRAYLHIEIAKLNACNTETPPRTITIPQFDTIKGGKGIICTTVTFGLFLFASWNECC